MAYDWNIQTVCTLTWHTPVTKRKKTKNIKKKHLWQKAPDLAVDLITVQLLNCVLPRQDFLDSSIFTIGWWEEKNKASSIKITKHLFGSHDI